MIRSGPFFEDRLQDSLAVLKPSRARTLAGAFAELRAIGGGVIIAVMGRLSAAEAQQLAACRAEGSQGIAVLLDVSSWSEEALRRRQANGLTAGANATGSTANCSATNGSAANGGTASSGSADSSTSTHGRDADSSTAHDRPLAGTLPVTELPVSKLPISELPAAEQPVIDREAAGYQGSADTVSLAPESVAGPAAPAGERAQRRGAETATAIGVLRSAGWHVISLDASTSLAVAWQRLPHAVEMLASAMTTSSTTATTGPTTTATTAASTTTAASAASTTTASSAPAASSAITATAVTTAATAPADAPGGQPA